MATLAELETLMRTAIDGTDPVNAGLLRRVEAGLWVKAAQISDGTFPNWANLNQSTRVELEAIAKLIMRDSRNIAINTMRLLLARNATETIDVITSRSDNVILSALEGVLRPLARGMHPERV